MSDWSGGGDFGANPWSTAAHGADDDLHIRRGTCYALYAYDVGLQIDLDAAERLITGTTQRGRMKRTRRAPQYFEFDPPPLRVTQAISPLTVAPQATDATVDLVLYDFGAVCAVYHIPLHGPLRDLVAVSDALYDNTRMLAESRASVEALLSAILPAVQKPSVAPFVEDYAIYHIEALAGAEQYAAALQRHAETLARILRGEPAKLSADEIRDALSCRISFGPGDLALIDWNGAILFDDDADDLLAVLEYANVELLEMRYLDDQLDAALEQAYAAINSGRRRFGAFSGRNRADLRRLSELQIESALLFENVNNALKLLGDQYLARAYRLASQRLHLLDWDASIMRKLSTIESIYQKISDQHNALRLEVLEWIIILLIAASIVLSLKPSTAAGCGRGAPEFHRKAGGLREHARIALNTDVVAGFAGQASAVSDDDATTPVFLAGGNFHHGADRCGHHREPVLFIR